MKKYSLWFIFGLLILMLAACGTSEDESGNQDEGDNADEAPQTVTVDHELGETEVDVNPEKVVVFDFGILDTLDELGVEVAGVPQNNIPSYLDQYESDEYENVGSLKEPDFEKIAEIDPDLIIISGRQSSLYDQLTDITDATIYLGVDTERYMDSFEENMQVIADIFDKEEEINEKMTAIEDSIAELSEKAEDSDKDALIILSNDDKISAYGPSSRFGIVHDVFGVEATDENIEASTHGQNVSFEYVKEENPDILYVIDRSAAIGEESSAQTIVENQLVESTEAYKNDDIYYLDPDFWYLSGGGLQSVQEMIEEIDASFE